MRQKLFVMKSGFRVIMGLLVVLLATRFRLPRQNQ